MKRLLAAIALACLYAGSARADGLIRSSAQPLVGNVSDKALIWDLQQQTTLGAEITGLAATGATVTIEGSTDGRKDTDANKVWFSTVAIPFTCPSPSTFTTVNADGPFKMDVSGLTNIRFRVSTTGTAGPMLVSINAIQASTLGSCGGTGGGGGSGGSVNIHDSAGNNLTSTGGALNVAGTFSATLTGFAPNETYATITAGAASSRVALPAASAVVVVYNTGAQPASIQLGSGSVVATASNDQVPANGWMAFTVGSNVDLAAIRAPSATADTTLVISGGAGLPTGAGGGSGSSSSANLSVSATGAAVPGSATYLGMIVGGNLTGVPGTANGLKVDGSAVTQPVSLASQPLPTGAATAANQEVTAAGTSATSAQGVQGVTSGIPMPVAKAPDIATNTAVTLVDSGTTCASTPAPVQTQCTGTPTTGSFASVNVAGQQGAGVTASITSGTVATVTFQSEFSWDGGATWYGRGFFLDSNLAPIWHNSISNAVFSGSISIPPGATTYRVRASTLTGASPNINIKISLSQSNSGTYVYNLPTSGAGTNALSAVNIQGEASGLPVITNQTQSAGVTLGSPTAVGTQGSGNAINVNSTIVGGTVTASFASFAPLSNYATLSVTGTSSRVALPSGTTVAIYNTGTNAAFVQLGSGSVVATATNDQVAPGGFLCLGVGANVDLAAIETAGTTSLNLSGGAGGCAGSGGGGGGGGGGGTSSNFGATFPSAGTADGFKDAGGLMQPGNLDASGNLKVTGTVVQATNSFLASPTTATDTLLVNLSGSTNVYVTGWTCMTNGAASANGSCQLEYSSSNSCTSPTALTPLWNFTVGNGGVWGSGIGQLYKTPAGTALCIKSGTTNKVDITGSYTQF